MEDVRTIGLPGERAGGRGFPPALAASAAFHLLALGAFLSSGGVAGAPPRAGVVEVLLAPAPGGPAEAARARPGPARAASRSAANEPAPVSAGVTARGVEPAPHAPVVPAPARGAAASGPPAPAAFTGGAQGAGALPGSAAFSHEAGPGRADVPREAFGPGAAVAAPGPRPGAAGRAGNGAGGAGVAPRSSGGPLGGSGGPPPATAAARGEGASGADGLAHGALRARIQSHIVYPEEAIRRGQEGEVVLRIRVDGLGAPLEIRVARSSGVRVLDDAARRGVIRSTPLPAAPGWVEVPVTFRLE